MRRRFASARATPIGRRAWLVGLIAAALVVALAPPMGTSRSKDARKARDGSRSNVVLVRAGTRRYRFENVTRKVGLPRDKTRTWGSVFVDHDGNGWPDLLVGRHLRHPWFYVNDGGIFSKRFVHDLRRPPAGRWYYDRHSCALGEANGDGRPDLYCVSGAQKGVGEGPNQLLIQTRDGGFEDRARRYGVRESSARGRSVNWLDHDRDGALDLFVGNEARSAYPNVMFRNTGRAFRRVAVGVGEQLATTASSWADWDRSGTPDLTVATHGRSGAVAYRNERRSFVRRSIPGLTGHPWTVATWGDYDGNGRSDVALVGASRLTILRNVRRGFVPAYSLSLKQGRAATWLDVDNDGDLDLFVVQGSPYVGGGRNRPDLLIVKRKRGFVRFRRASFRGPTGGGGDSVSSADFDRDGRVDLLVTNGHRRALGKVQLLRNRTRAGRSVTVRLIGPRRNPLGFGARIHVRTAAMHYQREVTDGVNFRGQSEMNPLHLGIRTAERARITVRWPNGSKDCAKVAAGRAVTIRRGSAPCP